MEKGGPSYRALCRIGSHGLNRSSWAGGQEEEGDNIQKDIGGGGNPARNKGWLAASGAET